MFDSIKTSFSVIHLYILNAMHILCTILNAPKKLPYCILMCSIMLNNLDNNNTFINERISVFFSFFTIQCNRTKDLDNVLDRRTEKE